MVLEYERTKIYDVEECFSVGKESEKRFYEYFHNVRGLEVEFVDLKDVDFVVTGKKGSKFNVDVKRTDLIGKYPLDRQRLCVEDVQNIYVSGSDGWYRYDKDDLVICHDELINGYFYMYRMKDLREYINTYYKGYDNSRIVYYKLRQSMCYGVYLLPFFNWLNDNDRFYKRIEYKDKIAY